MIKLKRLLETVLEEGVYDKGIFKAIFLAGGPGSGKSYVAGKIARGFGLKMLNSDAAFENQLRKANIGGKGTNMDAMTDDEFAQAGKLRGRALDTYANQAAGYESGRLGMIIDGTGGDVTKIMDHAKRLEDLGYDTYMVFVDTTLDVSQARNAQRKRKLPAELVKTVWDGAQKNKSAYQNYFGNRYYEIDNSATDVTDAERKAKEDIFMMYWKEVKKIIEKPPQNPIAQQWIDSEMERKKRG